ncbi:peptidase M16C associated-domain-containing protein [Delphinella strobiligena]|nr:peptidase M16C associated-domain-containing protein [Delphinella strobiligena]
MLRAVGKPPPILGRLSSRVHGSRRTFASVTDLAKYPQPGDQVHGFTLKRAKHVPELELTALHFEHDKTGADYLHIARDDSNNVFSIGFKTNPPDATGVPHILEHTTLCGSEKYPVRDPFFKMLPRSLSNFMNAFTSSDHTTYPFATTNAQDFKNLMAVYLDATLHPLLKEHDFTQEGWRLGPENPDKEKGSSDDIIFKGVVYNEMKGQMSDSSYLYYIRFQEAIFPAINNSGGDPQKMTDLTYDQLKKFHADHYHPSNSKVLTYGDMSLTDHLVAIGKELDKFTKMSPDSAILLPDSLENGPRYVTIKGPVDPLNHPDSQYRTSVSWLMGDSSDQLENFSLSLISSLLMDGYGSPFYRNLVEAGLGPDYSPNTGYDGSGRRAIFSVGLNGVKQENVPKVKEAIFKTLRETKEKGFEQGKIDGILHQLELSLKHKTANFGMGIIQRLKPSWFNGTDVFDALDWQPTVNAFKAEIAKGGYLEGLMEKYLLNDNTLTFTMEPSSTYSQDLLSEEAARLDSKKAEAEKKFGSKEQAYDQLRERELELVAQQMSEQDLSCMPSVHVKDIPRSKPTVETRQSAIDSVKVQWREAPTNGLTYFRALSIFKDLPVELRTFVPLFCDALMRIGTKTKSMEEIEDLIKLKTGGVSFGYHAVTSPLAIDAAEEGLSMSGYALDQNIPAMYDIMRMVILETDFESPRARASIKELLQSAASGGVDTIAESGHSYARRFAEAGITPRGRLAEQTGGITQIANISTLASHPDLGSSVAEELVKALKAIQSLVASNLTSMRIALTCGAESTSTNESSLRSFLKKTFSSSLQSSMLSTRLALPLRNWDQTITRNSKSFFPLPYQVYYSGLSFSTVPYVHESGAKLAILAQLLTHKHLHREIRERGGAYGGGAYSRGLDGIFGFYAYRDPNPENTIKVISEVGKWAIEKEFTEGDLEEAKLSVFQGLDAPRSVSEEGMTRFVSGVTPEMEQVRREQLLDVSRSQVRDVAEQFLIEGIKNGNMAVLGEPKPFANEKDGWKTVELGMGGAAEESPVEDVAAAASA